jgi:hypothetical protein
MAKKGGGGGGGYTPPAPIVMTDPVTGKTYTQSIDLYGQPIGESASDRLNADVDKRTADEKAKSDAAAAQKVADDAAALSKFNTSKTNAYNDALASVMNEFRTRGLDATPYLESDIKPLLNTRQASIKDLDPNPGAAYGTDLGSSIINNLTSGYRTRNASALDKIFTPGYSQTYIPDSLTGQYADTLLNEQFDPLNAQLTNSMKRGTLTDVGYNAALGKLGEKRSAAQATIGDLGKTIIGRERGELDDYIGKARSDVNALSLGSTFDPNVYQSGARNLIDADTNTFGGALRSAVGGTKFADLSELINAGGAVQGASNAGALKPTTGGGATPDDDMNKKRGLGSTGAF